MADRRQQTEGLQIRQWMDHPCMIDTLDLDPFLSVPLPGTELGASPLLALFVRNVP